MRQATNLARKGQTPQMTQRNPNRYECLRTEFRKVIGNALINGASEKWLRIALFVVPVAVLAGWAYGARGCIDFFVWSPHSVLSYWRRETIMHIGLFLFIPHIYRKVAGSIFALRPCSVARRAV